MTSTFRLLLVAVIALGLTGCGGSDPTSETSTFNVTVTGN